MLQAAIELELATLPPYLTAMWSIVDTTHPVRSLIHGVVMDEMLHLGLACNLLTTLGGRPELTGRAAPEYPGPLPGCVRPELQVRLEGLTKPLLREVFMEIEWPEDGPLAPELRSYATIGALYSAIADGFRELPSHCITGQHQITRGDWLFAVCDKDDALRAIQLIKEQGEGTSQSPCAGDKMAHYYAFAEVFHGRKLIEHPERGWVYEGAEVAFPEVRNVPPVPPGGYPDATQAFDKVYSNMLRHLEATWNGEPSRIGRAISAMHELTDCAEVLMDTPLPGGDGHYAPSWLYRASIPVGHVRARAREGDGMTVHGPCDVVNPPNGTLDCPWVDVDEALHRIGVAGQCAPGEVLILGAGIAGLTAAYELHRQGWKVTVWEGSDRVGGRLHTHRFTSGAHGELGAMRIPLSHDYTWHYVQEVAELPTRAFHNTHPNAFYDIRGRQCRMKDFAEEILPLFDGLNHSERETLRAEGPGGLLRHHMAPLIEALSWNERSDLLAGNLCSRRLRALGRETWRTFLQRQVETRPGVELLGSTLALQALWTWSLAEIIRDELHKPVIGDRRQPQLFEIKAGFDALPTRIAELLPEGTVQLGRRVTAIRATGADTVLHTDGEGPHHVRCPVLCTLPFPVLRQLDLDGFDADKLSAIRNVEYASSTKVLVDFTQRFWEQLDPPIVGGRSISDRLARTTYYPCDHAEESGQIARKGQGVRVGSWDFFDAATSGAAATRQADADPTRPGVLLASYSWNHNARQLGNLRDEEAVEQVLRDLEHIHPQIRQFTSGEARVMNWDRNPWARGAFAITPPGDLEAHYAAGIRPQGNVFFAGEHLSIAPGWIQGAIESSLRATLEILNAP